jgi:hypothetical protein
MSGREDRLYDLLPVVYRQRDAEQGYPLQALLRVIAEQVNVVEDDIARLYENWFIETCDDWAVPYIGDLIGYRPVHEAGELITRREVANTLRSRRRKGTLAILEELSADVAGWPALAVEFYRHLAFTQGVNHRRPSRQYRGRTVDLRRGEALDRLDGPFDEIAHNADVRRVASAHTPGRPNLPGVGLFVWRRRSYSVTRTPAYLLEESQPRYFTVSVLGNDTPLYVRPEANSGSDPEALGLRLPIPIRRRAFDLHKEDYYGEGKSLTIWTGDPNVPETAQVVPASRLVVADLSVWQYEPEGDQVVVDPELGRLALPSSKQERGVWVSYQYGFSADLGGGEYDRPLSQPSGAVIYRVGVGETSTTIGAALTLWKAATPAPVHAVIEITDSGVYAEKIHLDLPAGHTLQLRAAQHRRPAIRLVDWETMLADALTVTGGAGSAFTLDGLLVTGRPVHVEGPLAALTLRHSTLVPGWGLHSDCKPRRTGEPGLELVDLTGRVVIEHCILGSIEVEKNEVTTDPLPIRLSDSILDATGPEIAALSAPGHPVAHVRLTVQRSTVFGRISVHALELGENSLFTGLLTVARRQIGCLRFSSCVPGSRTPKRFECQPDLVEQATASLPAAEREVAKRHERERVRPLFRTMRYGSPDYARLADDGAAEIRRGADDESEMGAFHDLFEPQRTANLAARLDEYTPAGSDAGLIFAD